MMLAHFLPDSVAVDFRSTTEGLQEGVQQFDKEFEARLRGLKQQTQRSLVCFHVLVCH